MRHVGGPLDGQDISTKYDRLPVICFPHPSGPRCISPPQTIESYERIGHVRVHVSTRPYPDLAAHLGAEHV